MKTYLHKDGRVIREDEIKEIPAPPEGYKIAGALGDYEGQIEGYAFTARGIWVYGPWAGQSGVEDDESVNWPYARKIEKPLPSPPVCPDEPAPLKLEVGKRYVMRNGEVTGAMEAAGGLRTYPFRAGTIKGKATWTAYGKYWNDGGQEVWDIIREATPEECGEVAPDHTEGGKYRILEPGMMREAGDEFLDFDGSWKPTAKHGLAISKELLYRRRIDYAARAREQLQSLILSPQEYIRGDRNTMIDTFVDNIIQAAKQP